MADKNEMIVKIADRRKAFLTQIRNIAVYKLKSKVNLKTN